jgi:hemolysin activation/secretion protein
MIVRTKRNICFFFQLSGGTFRSLIEGGISSETIEKIVTDAVVGGILLVNKFALFIAVNALLIFAPGVGLAQGQPVPDASQTLGQSLGQTPGADPIKAEQVSPDDVEPAGAPLAAATPEPAQQGEPGSDAIARGLDVGAIAIFGLQTMTPGDFAAVIAPCIGKRMDADDLSELTNSIAKRAQAAGLPFATAQITPQRLRSGVIAVEVDEGIIDEVRLEGADHAGVRAALAPLVSGKPVRIQELERRLLLAADIDGVRITGRRYMRENGRGILIVTVSRNRFAVRATLTNEGTRVVGREQLTLVADINGVLASDDSVSFTWSGTPAQPGELQFGRVRYEKRVSRSGTEVIVTGAMALTRPGAYLAPLEIRSRSWQAGLSVLQPLVRRRSRSLWFQADFNLRNLHQTLRGALSRDERIVTTRGSLFGYTALLGGRLRGNVSVTQGLRILSASMPDNPFASRLDSDGTFTTLGFSGDWTGAVAGPVSLRMAMQGQLASQALPVSEELGLGGTNFLRGYDWFERSGDEGIMGLAELRYGLNKPFAAVRRAEFYGFLDGGTLSNRDSGTGGGTLASGGGGIRVDFVRSVSAGLEVAVPLTGERYDTGDRRSRVNFRVSTSF